MNTRFRRFWRVLLGQSEQEPVLADQRVVKPSENARAVALEFPENDPIVPYFLATQGVVEVQKLNLESPTLRELKKAGVKLTIPLISQGELIGLLNLGPRLSEQEYSTDDRRLLGNLATQAAPAVRVAQLVRQQQSEARKRERIEQELRVARIIQKTLLPKKLPELPGYRVSAYYQPARDVGGDFYDFVYFSDGRLGLIIGDVTDKGVPAALVMATTRSLLRGSAERLVSPGAVLQRANDLLCPDIPPNMFVTCLYALLDPASGRLQYANAGHNLPYRRCRDRVDELWASGMPLGLMPGMTYDENETQLAPGETLLLSSDGLVEAHNTEGEMFGFPRIRGLMADHPGGAELLDHLLAELSNFTGPDYVQEDDITLVALQRFPKKSASASPKSQTTGERPDSRWEKLAEFTVASEPGNERSAVKQLVEVLKDREIPDPVLERLKTAVAEATMNAMEHGNRYDPGKEVALLVSALDDAVSVQITDHGGGKQIPAEAETPDLDAKLRGEQSPRGWGLFLIKNMVDEMQISTDERHHTVELIMRFGEDRDESSTV